VYPVSRCTSADQDGPELEKPTGAKRRRRWRRQRVKPEPADKSSDDTGWVRWLPLDRSDLPGWYGL
jgi:hypothetical protein